MKVESENVLDLIKIVKAYVSGIVETVQIGDDGFQESINLQKNVLFEEIANWQAVHIVEKQKTEKEKSLEELTQQERWENELYAFLLRKVKSDNQIVDILKEYDLFSHIEQYLESQDGGKLKHFYFNVYVMGGIRVVQSIVDKVVEERKKSPQQKLL
jgi:hypothetical protein